MMHWRPRAGTLLILGAVALIVGELLHPDPPTDPAALLAMIGTESRWGICHLVQATGAVLVALGLIDRRVSTNGGSNARLRLVALAGVTLAVAALALDGDGFKRIADASVGATAAEGSVQVTVFAELLAVQSAMLDAATILLFGFAPLLSGLALAKGARGKAAGWSGVGLGAIAIALGSASFLHAPLPQLHWYQLMALSVAAWSCWVGVILWREPGSERVDRGDGGLLHQRPYVTAQHTTGRLRASFDIKKL